MFTCFWETEHELGGAEKEGDTEFEAGSRLLAVSTEPDPGLELTDREIMTWEEASCSTDWTTQAPTPAVFLCTGWNPEDHHEASESIMG